MRKVGIINVSFADDLLLFSRGDNISVMLVMEKFVEFSRSMGLVVNPAKCKKICGGMDKTQEQNLAAIIGFSIRNLPFQYLGIPLECILHVENIGNRINH